MFYVVMTFGFNELARDSSNLQLGSSSMDFDPLYDADKGFKDDEVTPRKRKERTDLRELRRAYREYKDFIIKHGGESNLENRERLTRACAIASVSFEVLDTVSMTYYSTNVFPMPSFGSIEDGFFINSGKPEDVAGNWKRAYVALHCLSKHVTSTKLSAKICCLRAFGGLIFPISLSNYLEGKVLVSSGEKSFQWGGPSEVQKGFLQAPTSWGYATSDNALSTSSARSEITDFLEVFDKLQNFAAISATEMMQIRAAIHLLDEVSNMQSSIDKFL